MPLVHTRFFGEIPFDQGAVIEFAAGVPGFEHETRFVAIEQPCNWPLVFLQSLATPELCFLTLPVLGIDPDYKLHITAEDLARVGLPTDRSPRIGSDVLCLAIISVGEGMEPTANLMSPLVVNLHNRQAVQAVPEEVVYSHRFRLAAAELAAC